MIVKRDFHYSPTGQNRPLHIWLPDSYDHSEERYPVMYFFDGHNLSLNEDATYGKSWGLKEFLEQWGKDMIVVGIECGHGEGERLSEYLPYPADRGSFCDSTPVLGDATLRWMVEELKPVIDRDYRTYPHRACTGIAGSSMGGLMALYGGVHHNDTFSKAACVSTAMGFCIRPVMKDLRTSPMDTDTRIYLSWGTCEAFGLKNTDRPDRSSKTYGWNKRVADHLRSLGCAVKMECQVGGRHCEADWEKQVPTFMNFLWME